jgi:hypothetical protein
MKNRQIARETGQKDSAFNVSTSVHFTVRFAMAKNPHTCRVLREWRTTIQPNGVVRWERHDKELLEENIDEHSTASCEFENLRDWCNNNFSIPTTDRNRFAAEHDTRIQVPDYHRSLDSFVTLLKDNLIFEGNQLAPRAMYPGI